MRKRPAFFSSLSLALSLLFPCLIALWLALPGPAGAAMRCAESDRLGNRSVGSIETGKGGVIKSFHWTMNTPAGGYCLFDSADFSEVPHRSGAEYKSAKGCQLFVWTQGSGTTLAPNACEKHCSAPEVYDYLWPIIFDKSGRGCGRTR